MAKHKVSELTGALLDAAVAKAEGWQWRLIESQPVFVWLVDGPDVNPEFEYSPSTSWAQGGPIIEREQMSVFSNSHGPWNGMMPTAHEDDEIFSEEGPTPLIAAMRAYVASRFGDEVDLPD